MDTSNTASFRKVLASVMQTGIGMQELYFRTNMDYVEFIDDDEKDLCIVEAFPSQRWLNGNLVIKFSNGTDYLGLLELTHSELTDAAEIISKDSSSGNEIITLGLVKLGHNYFDDDTKITLFLTFNCIPDLDGTIGKARILVEPGLDTYAAWFTE